MSAAILPAMDRRGGGQDRLHCLIGPCPCDRCPDAGLCRAESLACGDFAVFVNSGKLAGKDRTPTAETFAALFG